jgi:hypothetical protein
MHLNFVNSSKSFGLTRKITFIGESSNQNNGANAAEENVREEEEGQASGYGMSSQGVEVEDSGSQQANSRPRQIASVMLQRVRRLVSQSTLHENELDNEENNYPRRDLQQYQINHPDYMTEENSSEEESDADGLFEEYLIQGTIQENESRSDFDVELPVQHSYLGETDAVRGLTMYESHKIFEIPVSAHHALVYPNEILPMIMVQHNLFSQSTDDDDGLIMGLVFQNEDANEKSTYGVTCQIYEKGVDYRGHTTVKAKALQRFVVIKTEDNEIAISRNQIYYAKVKILPEILLPDPIQLTMSNNYIKHKAANGKTSSRIKRFAAASTQWPAFIYEHYSMVRVSEKIERCLSLLNLEPPNDPVQRSFWLARNLPLNENDRLQIFKENCVNQRLLMIGATLNIVSINDIMTALFLLSNKFHFNSPSP